MRPKVWIAVCGVLMLLGLGTYLYIAAPVPAPVETQPPGEPQPQKKNVTLEVVEPASFEELKANRTEIAGTIQWIIVNPSYKNGLLSIAIKTSEGYDILLGKWNASKRLELKLTHTHPSSRIRVAIGDYLGRDGPQHLKGDVTSITVRDANNLDPDGYGTMVHMSSGQGFFSSAALSGAVIIEFFYD